MAEEIQQKKKESSLIRLMPLIVLASVLVYAAAAYLLLFLPKLGKFMEGGEYDLKPLEVRIEEDGRYLKEIEAAIAKVEAINSEHKRKLGLMLPPNEDVPGLFVQLDEIARNNNMVLSTVDTVVDQKLPGPLNSKLVRISASFTGGKYEQFLMLLNDLEHLVRVTDVQTISFTTGSGNYSVTMVAYFIDGKTGTERVVR